MSNENEPPILSADDLMAVVDFTWHETKIGGHRSRQRGLEVDEWFDLLNECPDLEALFDDSLGKSVQEAPDMLSAVKAVGGTVLNVSRRTAAYAVSTSLGKREDAGFRAKAEKWPLEALRDGVCNLMDISFTEGGIEGFFTRLAAPLLERIEKAGLGEETMQKLFAAVAYVSGTQIVQEGESQPEDEAAPA